MSTRIAERRTTRRGGTGLLTVVLVVFGFAAAAHGAESNGARFY